jgi:deoxyribodipyrimidine photolyase
MKKISKSETMLIDYDVTSNWGNWQYVSGVAPIRVSLLNSFHCPYFISNLEQKRLNILVGKDYPKPIVKLKTE